MFVGHFGAGMGGARLAPRLSLGTLFVATQWADLLWPALLLLGLEEVRIAPGIMRASPLDFTRYPISHSLAALVGWAALLAGIHFFRRRDALAAMVVGALVVSHWFLDVAMHRPDLPVWPGGPRVGLGLWNSVPATILVESALYAAGLALYLRSTRARDRVGSWGLWLLLIFLYGGWFPALFGPPPPNVGLLATSTLILGWVVAAWAYLVGAHREARRSEASRSARGDDRR